MAAVLLAPLLVLCLLEAGARIAGSFKQDVERRAEREGSDWMVTSPDLGWQRRAGFRGWVGGGERSFDGDGFLAADSEQVRQRGAKRVLFIGDSNTFGFGASTPASFVEQVEAQVPGVAAINLGVIGYSSLQGRLALAKYAPELKPDLIVASFSFNDRRYASAADAADSPEVFQRVHAAMPFARVMQWLEWSHLVRLLRGGLQAAGLLPAPPADIDLAALRPRVSLADYRRNLAGIAQQGKALGVPVVFLLLHDHPVQSDHLRKGIDRLAAGDAEGAVGWLKSAAREHPMFSDLAKLYLARAYQAAGETELAQQARRTRSEYRSFSGGTLIEMDDDYNAAMREVAAASGAEFVDAGSVLDRMPAVYIDFCHFNAAGHRVVAQLLAARIEPLLFPGRPAGQAKSPAS